MQLFFAYHPATAVNWTLPAQIRLRTQSAKSRHEQEETAAFKSASLAIDKTQHVGVNLHVCGFKPTVGLQQRFPVAAQNAGDTREASL